MPLPMYPTQLTVLTRASVSACRRFPSACSIIAVPPLKLIIIPVRPNPDDPSLISGERGHNLLDFGFHSCIDYHNLLDQLPGTEAMDKKFCLLAALSVHVVEVVTPVTFVHHIPVYPIKIG